MFLHIITHYEKGLTAGKNNELCIVQVKLRSLLHRESSVELSLADREAQQIFHHVFNLFDFIA